MKSLIPPIALACLIAACSRETAPIEPTVPAPREIIDLGAVVTEDLPERIWGKALMERQGFDRNNAFDVIYWKHGDEAIIGSNAYYTIFNHGGPHVDAPNHVGAGGGINTIPAEAFSGPLKVIDASALPPGRSVTVGMLLAQNVRAGDIIIIYTSYAPPETDDVLPEIITLTHDAANYLAELPVRAFGTDALTVDSLTDDSPVDAESPEAEALPVHYPLLSHGVPVYEQLFNVDQLLDKEIMYFTGAPLNIKDGDGMIVRPMVFVY